MVFHFTIESFQRGNNSSQYQSHFHFLSAGPHAGVRGEGLVIVCFHLIISWLEPHISCSCSLCSAGEAGHCVHSRTFINITVWQGGYDVCFVFNSVLIKQSCSGTFHTEDMGYCCISTCDSGCTASCGTRTRDR